MGTDTDVHLRSTGKGVEPVPRSIDQVRSLRITDFEGRIGAEVTSFFGLGIGRTFRAAVEGTFAAPLVPPYEYRTDQMYARGPDGEFYDAVEADPRTPRRRRWMRPQQCHSGLDVKRGGGT